jgi:hypothetical protein
MVVPSAPPAHTTTPTAGPSTPAIAGDLLAALWRVVQAIGLYGEQHASTRTAADRAAETAAVRLTGAARVRAVVDAGGFVVDGVPVGADAGVAQLADRARALRVGAIEFAGIPTAADFRVLACAIALRALDVPWTARDADDLSGGTGGRLRAPPVSYVGLRVADGTLARGGDTARWSRLVDAMTSVGDDATATSADDAELVRLACALRESAERGDTTLDGLAAGIADAIRWAEPSRRELVLARARVLLSRLSPELRAALVGMDLGDGPRAAARLDALEPALPIADVFDALERSSGSSVVLCRESVRMLTKLVTTAETAAQAERVHGVIDRAAREQGVGDIGAALSELLASRGANAFNPAEYQARLDELLRPLREKLGVDRPPALSLAWEDELSHVALIGADLLADLPEGTSDATVLISALADNLGLLAEGGFVDEIAAGAAKAEACRRAAPASGVDAAASRLREALGSPALSERLVRAASSGRADPLTAAAVARAGGARMIAAAVLAAVNQPEPVRRVFFSLLEDPGLDAAVVGEALGAAPVDAVLSIVEHAGLGARVRSRLIGVLIESPDAPSRRQAFGLLASSGRAWSEHELTLALRDADTGVRGLGLRAAPDAEGAGFVLVAFIGGDLGTRPTTDEFWTAHNLLAAHPSEQTDTALLGVASGLLRSSPLRGLGRLKITLFALAEVRSSLRGGGAIREPLVWASIVRDLLKGGRPC